MLLADATAISRLQAEFGRSMRRLLNSLCRDLERQYGDLAAAFELPADYFRFVGQRLEQGAFSGWKVVGWIDALNDLVYFLDVLAQLSHEEDQQGFAEQLFADCEQSFFENSYIQELFPHGPRQAGGLAARLHSLCGRLARETTQESLFFNPQFALQWVKRRRRDTWAVAGRLAPSFERAERAYTVPLGTKGDALIAPISVRRAVGQSSRLMTFVLTPNDIVLRCGRRFVLGSRRGDEIRWCWPQQELAQAAAVCSGSITVGPTLHYGRRRQPKSLSSTDRGQVARISRACLALRRAWPQGHALLKLLTSRVIPLHAPGVVSFSYRHRPGLSFINCFDRDNLDLIDDLIHENSHHHLNLLLRKHVYYHGDRNQQIFYSPWRRTLRPIRGILHASFTFTMGAVLFARLSAWAETAEGKLQWQQAGLTARHLARARFRCLEEIESVRYSLADLKYARRHLKWITGSGMRLVASLEAALMGAERDMSRHRRAVLDSSFGSLLRKHVSELRRARQTYGPMSVTQA